MGSTFVQKEKFIILGAGGAAREMYHVIRFLAEKNILEGKAPCECVGFLQDPEYLDKIIMPDGYPPIIGPIHGYTLNPEFSYILGVGGPENRFAIAELFRGYYEFFPSLFAWGSHVIDFNSIKIGYGTTMASILSCNTRVGNFVYLNGGTLGHDSEIDNYCEIGPGTRIGGHVTIEEGVQIAPNCTIAPGVRIGAWSRISANTSVLKNVPPCSLVMGVPGIIHKDFYCNPREKNKLA